MDLIFKKDLYLPMANFKAGAWKNLQQRNKCTLLAWREARPWLWPVVHVMAGLLCLVGLLGSNATTRQRPAQTWLGLGLQIVFCVAALYAASRGLGAMGPGGWGLLNAVPWSAWAFCGLAGALVWLARLGEEALRS